MKTKGYFLDDERIPEDVTWIKYEPNIDWTVVRSGFELAKLVFNELPNTDFVISFDHDLQEYRSSGAEITGYWALKKILDMYFAHKLNDIPFCYFHSMNPIGVKKMQNLYDDYRRMLILL